MALKLRFHLVHVLSVSDYVSFSLLPLISHYGPARLLRETLQFFLIGFLHGFPSWNIGASFAMTHLLKSGYGVQYTHQPKIFTGWGLSIGSSKELHDGSDLDIQKLGADDGKRDCR